MSDAPCRIRLATERDKPEILRLAPRLAEGLAPWRDHEAAIRAAQGWLVGSFSAAARHEGAVLVAVGETGVIGVISVTEQRHFTGETDGYIGELAVDSPAARRGVGSALMAAAEAWAGDRGLRNLTLLTGAANTTARHFYAALGFREEEVRLTRPLRRRASEQEASG